MNALKKYWDSLLVYFATLAGVMLTYYLPSFKSGQEVNLSYGWGRLIISAFIAIMLVSADETDMFHKSSDDEREIRRAGRKKNLKRRISHAIAQGISWNTIIS